MCSCAAEHMCVCNWKSIAAGETVVLECTSRDDIDNVMFFAVSRPFLGLTLLITSTFFV